MLKTHNPTGTVKHRKVKIRADQLSVSKKAIKAPQLKKIVQARIGCGRISSLIALVE